MYLGFVVRDTPHRRFQFRWREGIGGRVGWRPSTHIAGRETDLEGVRGWVGEGGRMVVEYIDDGRLTR